MAPPLAVGYVIMWSGTLDEGKCILLPSLLPKIRILVYSFYMFEDTKRHRHRKFPSAVKFRVHDRWSNVVEGIWSSATSQKTKSSHLWISKLIIIDSHNGLSPGWRQAIIWTNAGMFLIEIPTFAFEKMRLKVSFAKWRPFVSASMC